MRSYKHLHRVTITDTVVIDISERFNCNIRSNDQKYVPFPFNHRNKFFMTRNNMKIYYDVIYMMFMNK